MLESIVLGIYLWFKIYFLIDTNAKIWTEIIDLVILGRNYWSSCRVYTWAPIFAMNHLEFWFITSKELVKYPKDKVKTIYVFWCFAAK